MSESNGTPTRGPRPAHLLIPALVFAAYALVVLWRPHEAVLSLFSDDAFYYFEIARNVIAGHGCSFDGIAPTNGFHPLWMLVVLAVFAPFGAGATAPLAAMLLVCGAIAVTTLALIHRTAERYIAPRTGFLAVSAALLPILLTAMINGLETGLQLLLATALCRACYRHRLLAADAPPARLAVLGVFIALVTLARLDGVFLVVAALAMVLIGSRGRSPGARLAQLLALGGAFSLTLAPYLVWNVVVFGHLTPSSGAAKSAFPALDARLSLSGDELWGALLLAALWASVIVARVRWPWRRAATPVAETGVRFTASPLTLIAVASTLHFAHVVLFLTWGVYWWHFTLYALGLALSAGAALSSLAGGRARIARWAVVTVGALLIGFSLWSKARELPVKAMQHAGWYDAARWARDHTGEDDVFALVDAGLFGYFSQRHVVNLDGKANSYDYLQRVDEGTVEEYLAEVGTRYVANIRVRYVDGRSRIYIPRVNRPGVVLEMQQAWEVYRSVPIPSDLPRFGPVPTSSFVIWELPPP